MIFCTSEVIDYFTNQSHTRCKIEYEYVAIYGILGSYQTSYSHDSYQQIKAYNCYSNYIQIINHMLENYKGIMLCSRPQQSINLDYHKPFVSRVTHAEPIGYNPVKQLQLHKPTKQQKPILKKHKEWLEQFKKTKLQEKQEKLEQNKSSIVKVQSETKQQQDIEQPQSQDIEEIEGVDETEIQELLDFAKGLDYESYIQDMEVKIVVEALKKRIEEIKKEKPNIKAQKQVQKKDTVKEYINEEEWINGKGQKQSNVEMIARKLAEEILKKNKYLRNIHSNLSFQKLIETEARRQLSQ
ncbi:hypothetical protein pb186bvf_002519 [Paramecium bursaria]